MSWLKPEGLAKRLFLESLLARLLLTLVITMGLFAWQNLPRESTPDLDIPQALVMTEWPGASPEQVEKEVTKYLEDEIRNLRGLKSFTSGSYNSASMVAVEFNADLPTSDSMQRLRAAIDTAQANFPKQAKKPNLEEISVANTPALTLMLHGNSSDMARTETARRLKRKLELLSDVKKVNLSGMRDKSLHIQLHPEKLRMFGISPATIRKRLQSANIDMGWGEFASRNNNFSLYLQGRFASVDSVRQLPVIRLSDNRVVRLSELATVEMRLDRDQQRSSFSQGDRQITRGIIIDVMKRPGADTIKLIRKAIATVDHETNADNWPKALAVSRVTDDGELIQLTFDDISSSMIQAVLIVFTVLMFLLSWREALIAGLGIPVTLLAMLGVLPIIGYTFNSMVMIGMVLALGMLVDVFILVMEGMHEGIYVHKKSFSEAALSTVKTFAVPAVAGQMTTILALLPMLAVGGIDGKFIRVLPVTMIICLLFSLAIAFLICIPLSKRLLSSGKTPKALYIDKLTQRWGTKLEQFLLTYSLTSKKRASLWGLVMLVLFVISISLSSLLPVEMYPQSDDRKLGIALELAPDATLEQSQRASDKVMHWLSEQPWIEKVISYTGAYSPVTTANLKDAILPNKRANLAGFTVLLPPKQERLQLSFYYVPLIHKGLTQVLADEPGVRLQITHLGGNPDTSSPVEITLTGPDYRVLAQLSRQVQEQLQQIPGAVDVRDNIGSLVPELQFTFDSEKLSFYKLSKADAAEQVRIAMSEDEFSRFKLPGTEDDPKIRMGYQWPSNNNEIGKPGHIAEMYLLDIINPKGQAVPLRAISDYLPTSVPRVYTHDQGQRAVSILARTEGATAAGVMLALQPKLKALQTSWPEGYNYKLGGELAKASDTYGQMGMAFMGAVLLILIMLAMLYNSLRQPLIILLIIPLAITSVFFGYFLSAIALSFSGLVGIVSLAGIAVNNAIVLVDTANRNRNEGMTTATAAAKAASMRLRPIISTSVTTILGLLPLAFSDPSWYPLCMAIIFGLLGSTVIALVIIPCLYLLLTPEQSSAPASPA